jgi:hypothetical protein
MICCALVVATVATEAIGWRQFRRFLGWRLNAHSLLAASVIVIASMAMTGLAAEHLVRHAHAADEQALLTAPGALPLCRGGSPGGRRTDIASFEE